MIRTTFVAALALVAASTAVAQTAGQTAPPADPQSPEMQAYLRARGESYSRAPDSQQNPAEVAITAKLNAAIVAGNDAAERSEAEARAAHDEAQARWREAAASAETQRAPWEADKAAADAADAEYQRARAAWEGLIRACEASGRTDCRANGS
jgi:hypothetical protein